MRGSALPTSTGCKPARKSDKAGLEALVRAYGVHNRPKAQAEKYFFMQLPDLAKAIEHAGLAKDGTGRRFRHQNRIPGETLKEARKRLLAGMRGVRRLQNFYELHGWVESKVRTIPGIGELYVYDTALRLGAFLGFKPDRVYLHAGTRTGARALGLSAHRGFVDLEELPAAIQRLEPDEIEDFLCIYKSYLKP